MCIKIVCCKFDERYKEGNKKEKVNTNKGYE